MVKDSKCETKTQASRIAVQVVTKLSKLQDMLNKDGSENSSQQIKEIGDIQRYLLTNFSDSKNVSMILNSEEEIDYLILCAESDADTIYQGTLPDHRIFKFTISSDGSRALTLFNFSSWMDKGMESIANKVFRGKRWVAERPLLRDSNIMHFMEET